MYSRDHALLSALLGAGLVLEAPPAVSPVRLWLFVVALGVGIDLDHVLLARLNTGSWESARRCLRDPRRVLLDQEEIFGDGDVWRDQRLFSHVLLGGVLVAGAWWIRPYWAVATALTLYVHVLADLYSDVRSRESYFDEVVRHRSD
ncbi:MAG: hypothetical protein ABEJ74_06275 [Haloferacaceae archaeon]